MNKTTKYILLGIGSAVGIFAVMVIVRMLVRGVSIAEAANDWTNILIAVCCGASTGISTWKRDQEKEEKEKAS